MSESKPNLHQLHGAIQDKLSARHEAENQRMFSMARKLSQLSLSENDLGLPKGGSPGRQILMEDEELAQHLLPEELEAIRLMRAQRGGKPQRQPQRQAPLTEAMPNSMDGFDFDMPQRTPDRQFLVEDDVAPAPAPRRTVDWVVKNFVGETRGGAQVPVWKVINPKNGFSHQTLFRIEEVANKIAAILNETGNANDPRVVSIVNAYTKRDKLLKEARVLEKESAGKPIKSERLRQLKAEIATIDYRLGI